jgi:type IV pilus assembly protein PilW
MNRSTMHGRQQGFTLIELMIATTIFLIAGSAIFFTMAASEGQKRATTSEGDIDQNASYLMYRIGELLRTAGSDFSMGGAVGSVGSTTPPAEEYSQAYGCQINESISGTVWLPGHTGTGAFALMPTTYYVAPVIIYQNKSPNGASDVLAIMSGSDSYEQTAQQFAASPTIVSAGPTGSALLNLSQTVTMMGSDLLLVTDVAGTTTQSPCLIEQIGAGFLSQTNGGTSYSPPLSGTYYSNGPATKALSAFSVQGEAVDLGTTAKPPNFLLIGTDADNSSTSTTDSTSLWSYDILNIGGLGTTPSRIGDGVVLVKALYWVDTNNDGIGDTWEVPTTGGTYGYDTLTNGTSAAVTTLKTIKAVRIGLIMRSQFAEKNPVSAPQPTLFSNSVDPNIPTGLSQPLPNWTTGNNQNYHDRTYEMTVPLRNVMYIYPN